ncbi:MAG: adenosylmethionine--8-amino-7-oxononanoate transaminase [Polyangiales bacterium]
MSSDDELIRLDRAHLWRPYTSSEDHETRPLFVVDRAEGPWLIGTDGRRVLDGSGSWWCNNLGHGHPRLRAALCRQSERLMHCTLAAATHEQAAKLAAELVEAAPTGLDRVFYSDNGSTAVEVSLKIAFQYWQQNGRPERQRFLALPGAYHGDTLGTMSTGSVDAFNGIFRPLLFDVQRPADPVDQSWEPVFEKLLSLLRKNADHVAAVIVEPIVQGAAGMRMYPAGLLAELRRETQRLDTFFIADEVFTGMGRTGPMWACEHAGIVPDLLCTAKGLSGGALPFAATLATDRIYGGFRGDKSRAFMHGHTFCGNPLGAALAREVLAIYREDRVLEAAKPKAIRLAKRIAEMREVAGVTAPRALGMVAAFEVGERGYMGTTGWQISDAALGLGAHLRPLGNTVYIVPPLNIEDADLDRLLDIVRESTERVLLRAP